MDNLKELLEKELNNLKEQGLAPKYEHAGVYSISIKDKVVYVGKSRDMLQRIASHILHIKYESEDNSNKYRVLRGAKNRGIAIRFDVLYYADELENIDDIIGEQEARLIRQLRPALNYQLPLLENYHKYEVNKKAKTITLDEILGKKIFEF